MADLTATEVKNLNRRREKWMLVWGVVGILAFLGAVLLTAARLFFEVQVDATPAIVVALLAMHQMTKLRVDILSTNYNFTIKRILDSLDFMSKGVRRG